MAKRIKTELEKSYITAMWTQRKRYNDAKTEYDSSWGSWQDGERMKKAKREFIRLRDELKKARIKYVYRNAA